MAGARKLQAEIDRTLKKVEEGVAEFDALQSKVEECEGQALKAKMEDELKKELKKLQKHRDRCAMALRVSSDGARSDGADAERHSWQLRGTSGCSITARGLRAACARSSRWGFDIVRRRCAVRALLLLRRCTAALRVTLALSPHAQHQGVGREHGGQGEDAPARGAAQH